MTYPRRYSIEYDRGILLLDVLLAMALGLLFIVIVADMTSYSHEIFSTAKAKSAALDQYEKAVTENTIASTTFAYGNEMMETDISTSSLSFIKVKRRSDSVHVLSSPYPMCSIDFSNVETIGSHDWFQKLTNEPASLSPSKIHISSVTYALTIDARIRLTDLEVRGDTAYISADSNISSDPDFYIVRLDKDAPSELIDSINTGPGISSFVLAGKYIYAAALSTVGQLQVLSRDATSRLSFLARYKLPLPYATATPPIASSISYAESKVYLGTEKWDGEEFSVIDVSDPISPRKAGGLETGTKISDILIQDGLAYIADADLKQARVVDVSDADELSLVSYFSPAGGERQEGQVLSIFEGNIGFGRTSGGFNRVSEHELFIGSSTEPFALPSLKSLDMPGGVYGIISDRRYLYVLSRQLGNEFQIFRHDLDEGSSLKSSLASMPQAMSCYLDRIFVLSKTSPEIYELTFSEIN